MKRLFPIICLFSLIAAQSFAGSATWNANPISGDWNDPANWTPATVPLGINDIATFGVSNLNNISMSEGGELGAIVFNPGASSYTLDLDLGFISYMIPMPGVTNNSGVTQHITTSPGISTSGGLLFDSGATAGKNITYTSTGEIEFFGHSSADESTIFLENGGEVLFGNKSSADESTIFLDDGSSVLFREKSTAANSTVTANYGCTVQFIESSTAGEATLIADGGSLDFENKTDGGSARFELRHFGTLTVQGSGSDLPFSIGSLEGNGTVETGRLLQIGGNGLSTVFTGHFVSTTVLTKVGPGTLTLTRSSPSLVGAEVQEGALVVNNIAGSGTGTGPVTVVGGALGGGGGIEGAVTIGTGVGAGALLAPSFDTSKPRTLTIRDILTIRADGTYTCKLSTSKSVTDQVITTGVSIERGARLVLISKGDTSLTTGTVFTLISNTSATPISGTFTNLPDDSIITVGPNKFQVSYSGGDGNDLTLTVGAMKVERLKR